MSPAFHESAAIDRITGDSYDSRTFETGSKALELIEAWGFKYKTVGFYWAKTNKRANLDSLSRDDFSLA